MIFFCPFLILKQLNNQSKLQFQEEGFPQIANTYRLIAKVEQMHEARYIKLMERLESGTEFEEAEPIEWMCRQCGFTITAKAAPKRCPVCGRDQGWFERKATNY